MDQIMIKEDYDDDQNNDNNSQEEEHGNPEYGEREDYVQPANEENLVHHDVPVEPDDREEALSIRSNTDHHNASNSNNKSDDALDNNSHDDPHSEEDKGFTFHQPNPQQQQQEQHNNNDQQKLQLHEPQPILDDDDDKNNNKKISRTASKVSTRTDVQYDDDDDDESDNEYENDNNNNDPEIEQQQQQQQQSPPTKTSSRGGVLVPHKPGTVVATAHHHHNNNNGDNDFPAIIKNRILLREAASVALRSIFDEQEHNNQDNNNNNKNTTKKKIISSSRPQQQQRRPFLIESHTNEVRQLLADRNDDSSSSDDDNILHHHHNDGKTFGYDNRFMKKIQRAREQDEKKYGPRANRKFSPSQAERLFQTGQKKNVIVVGKPGTHGNSSPHEVRFGKNSSSPSRKNPRKPAAELTEEQKERIRIRQQEASDLYQYRQTVVYNAKEREKEEKALLEKPMISAHERVTLRLTEEKEKEQNNNNNNDNDQNPSPPERKRSVSNLTKRNSSRAHLGASGKTTSFGGGSSSSNNNNTGGVTIIGQRTSNQNDVLSKSIIIPKQPQCDPEDLELPVDRILDLVWEKYKVPNNNTTTSTSSSTDQNNNNFVFPTSKIYPGGASKHLFPGNKIEQMIVDEIVETVIDDRSAEMAKSLPFSGLAKKEFLLVIRVLTMANNWKHLPNEYAVPEKMNLEDFAKVAAGFQIEKPGHLFFELTSSSGTTKKEKSVNEETGEEETVITLVQLAYYYGKNKKNPLKNAKKTSNLAAQRRMSRFRKNIDAVVDTNTERAEQELLENAAFPRQPRVAEPRDLTLPSSRILDILFDKMGEVIETHEDDDNNNDEKKGDDGLEENNTNNNNNKDDDQHSESFTQSSFGSSSMNSSFTAGGVRTGRSKSVVSAIAAPKSSHNPIIKKQFPLTKMQAALNKVWPGNEISPLLIDDTIDCVLEVRRQEMIAKRKKEKEEEEKLEKDLMKSLMSDNDDDDNNNQNDNVFEDIPIGENDDEEQQQQQQKKEKAEKEKKRDEEEDFSNFTQCTHDEFVLIFRVIANLNNWAPAFQKESIPAKALGIDDFAKAATLLKLEKPGKLYMELTENGSKPVDQAHLALYFSTKKKKTFRASWFTKNDSNNNSPAAAGATTTATSTGERNDDEENQDDRDDDADETTEEKQKRFASAALKIQSAQRQRLSRTLFKTKKFINLEEKKKLEQEADTITQLFAVVKIQSIFRKKRDNEGLVRTKRFANVEEKRRLEEEAAEQERKYEEEFGKVMFMIGDNNYNDDDEEEL